MALNIVDESTLTVSSSSIGLSSASPTLAAAQTSGARQAVITVLTAPIHYHQDGGDATTSDPLLYPSDVLPVLGDSMRSILTNLRFIQAESVDATLVIRWYDRDIIHTPPVIRGTLWRGKSPVTSSGLKTADAQIKSTAGNVYWLTISDTAACVIQLNDSTGSADDGTDLWQITIPADGYGHIIFDPPLEFDTGIFLDVPTGAGDIIVGYI